MSRSIVAAVALGVALIGAGAAYAIEVSRSAIVPGNAAALWQRIGAFCAISDWHPVVAACEETEEDGSTVRTLSLEGGGTIRERLIERTDTGYTYEILDSPLPVENYEASFGVTASGDSATVGWSGRFDAKGAPDADAEAVIAGIYQAGLDAIAAD